MTAIAERPQTTIFKRPSSTTGIWGWMTTSDHKKIGIMYGYAAFTFFIIGGVEALLLRVQLAQANSEFLSAGAYNALFTMHGTTMVFLFIMPASAAFMNYLIPLMIGARDVAFPRLNALSWWIFFFGGIFLYSTFIFGTSLAPISPEGIVGNLPASGGPGSFNWIANLAGWGLVRVSAQCWSSVFTGHGDGLLGFGYTAPRPGVADFGSQLHRHCVQHASKRDAIATHAGLCVDVDSGRLPVAVLASDHRCRPVHGHI